MDVARARQLIRELSPLAADDVEVLGAGTDSAAFRVDGAWVVRFPLVADARATLATELALLPELAPQLPVAVPRPEHVAERDGQLMFCAYRALEGEPLSDPALRALSPPARARALDELATIARQRRAFEDAQPRPSTPVLLHADIKPEHLLHDPATGALTGLLDWGDVSLGHSDFDLAIISAFCGPRTLQGLLDRLPDAAAARAAASIPFLLTLRWLQDAVFDIARGDEPCLRVLHEQLA
jgi:aminoglycoside 2''-phosphotransferase